MTNERTTVSAPYRCVAAAVALALVAAGPPTASTGDVATHLLIYNATPDPVAYSLVSKGSQSKVVTDQLKADNYYDLRKFANCICKFGTPTVEMELVPGNLYQFTRSAKGQLRLIRFPLRPRTEPATKPAVWETAAPKPRDEAAPVRLINLKLRPEPASVVPALVEVKEPLRLDKVELVDGKGLATVTVPAPRGWAAPRRVRLTAEAGPMAVSVRPDPVEADLRSDGHLNVRLRFDTVSGGGEFTGRLTITPMDGVTSVSYPLIGEFVPRLSRLASAPDTLTVLSWPTGAPVYLASTAGKHPWAWRYLGRTPVRDHLPPGRYRLALYPPAEGDGEWAAPGGVSTVGSSAPLTLPLTKSGGTALVRGLWLSREGPPLDRLERATKGSADLFDVPPIKQFQTDCYRVFGRLRVEVTERDVERLHGVLRKTGYLRYPLGGGEAVEVEPSRVDDEPLLARVVKTPE